MKARYNKVSKNFQKQIRNEVAEHFKEQSNDMTRRCLKLFCVASHMAHGHAKKRLMRTIDMVEEISRERDMDEVFWSHIDQYNKSLGLDFPDEDYDRMDD